jgi:hypothetical protein
MMSTRSAVTSETILHRIRSEYFEMPGLSLTTFQAQRLWGLTREECEILLEQLVLRRFLRQTRRGAFVKV